MSKVWETPISKIMHKKFVQCDKKFNYNDVRAQRNLLPAFVKFNDGLTARQWIESELGGAGANWIHLQVDDGKWVVPAFCSWIQCMPEVKDQRGLQICHVLSTATTVEVMFRIVAGVESMLNWSELIECHPSATPHAVGCLPDYCYEYAMIYGITMRYGNDMRKKQTIDGFNRIPQCNEEYLLLALTTQPVLATMMVGPKFKYASMDNPFIYEGEEPSEKLYCHAIVIVGYGEENSRKFFIIQNSWGKNWGHDGYLRIARDVGNERGVGSLYLSAMYPVMDEWLSEFDILMINYKKIYNRERMGMQLPLPRDPIVHANAPGPSPALGLPSDVSYFNCQHCSNPCSKITIGDHWATCGVDAPVLD